MNPEDVANLVAGAILNRKFNTTNSWKIVWREGRFLCIPKHDGEKGDILIINATQYDFDAGFTSRQWNIVKTKGFKICQQLEDYR